MSTFFPIVSGGLTGLALALKWNLQSFRTSLKEKIGGENLSNKEDKKYHRPCQRVHGAEQKMERVPIQNFRKGQERILLHPAVNVDWYNRIPYKRCPHVFLIDIVTRKGRCSGSFYIP